MAKTNTPFFGLGSQGTVGGSLTSQKRGSTTILREKPVPTDPRTSPQLWHRHIYLLACQLWNGLTASQKQTYRSTGARYHRPGLAQFLNENLPLLHSLAAYWPLDISTPSLTEDYTGNRNHLTLYGASPIAGVFNNALHFDGLNDYGQAADSPTLDLSSAFSIAIWVRNAWSIQKSANLDRTFLFQHHAGTNEYRFYLASTAPAAWDINRRSSIVIVDALWHFALCVFTTTTLHIYIDGILRDGPLTGACPTTMRTNNEPLQIGRTNGALTDWKLGDTDEPMLIPVALDQDAVTLLYNRTESP